MKTSIFVTVPFTISLLETIWNKVDHECSQKENQTKNVNASSAKKKKNAPSARTLALRHVQHEFDYIFLASIL